MDGWTKGQWVTSRYFLRASNGWSTYSAFQQATWVPGTANGLYGETVHYPFENLPASQVRAQAGLSWTVQVQFGYWTGSTWAFFPFLDPDGGYTRNGGIPRYTTCYT